MFVWKKDDLNREQEDAIFEEDSVFLVACPGSGKTRTLTYKIAYELSRIESKKQFIVAITYTNTAADEIKERVELLGVDIKQLWIGTIHAFCLDWIIKPYGLYHDRLKTGYSIIDPFESEKILTELCEPYKSLKVSYYDCDYIAMPSGCKMLSEDGSKTPYIKKVLIEYGRILRENRQIDFELILHYTNQLILKKPLISVILSNLFKFILIDEYQDTKEIQYHIISSVLKSGRGKTKALIVGDPNQSIYETMGGYPIVKEDLEELIGYKLRKYNLSSNYRSSSKIIEYFDYYKTSDNDIIAGGKNHDYNSIITYNNAIDESNLEDEIVDLIRYNINECKISPNEICVAAPQWYPLAKITRNLITKLPEYSFNGPGMAPFARNLDNFWYKVGRIALTEPDPRIYIRRLRWSAELIEELFDLGVDVNKITNKNFLRFCNSLEINKESGLEYLEVFFFNVSVYFSFEIKSIQRLNDDYNAFFEGATSRIKRAKEENNNTTTESLDNFKKVFKPREGIKVTTIHGTKGEEYDTVIGFGLVNDWVPHFTDDNGDANSSKMLYVLSSRARKNLHLFSERGRSVHRKYAPEGKPPTPCLGEYDFEYDDVVTTSG
ncbi:ATP-dependent helicase [Labilibaculum sp. DW002]|uniref:DNA 3'-5' helicase n=1 Tax=Paralabilibaculum antarcticum TaxID=2912572 RepID=A0ABT5VWI0_9BACT|nr:ATP-dependent helicase [Labilibaculum sp. DW002]MDE5419781.1 ATP-dependent helicase [Labilibaculum sp. DW002]